VALKVSFTTKIRNYENNNKNNFNFPCVKIHDDITAVMFEIV